MSEELFHEELSRRKLRGDASDEIRLRRLKIASRYAEAFFFTRPFWRMIGWFSTHFTS
jgi:hypothetical protein